MRRKDPKDPIDTPQPENESESLVPAEDYDLEDVALEKAPDRRQDLSVKQQQAIMHLTCGKSILETARLVGIDPSTIHRWRTNSFKFQSALNATKRRVLEAAQSLLIATSLKAAENVSDKIVGGDAVLSFRLLDKQGVLSLPEIEAEDPITLGVDAVQEEWIKTIREGGLAALGQLFRAIEKEQGEVRKEVEKFLESGLEPDEDDDEVS